MTTEEKVKRAKNRIDALRRIHTLNQEDVTKAMGMSRANYHANFKDTTYFSTQALMGVCQLFEVTEYDLLHATTEEFKEVPIIKSYVAYLEAEKAFVDMQLGYRQVNRDIAIF